MHPIEPASPPYPQPPYARDELLHEIFAATAARSPDATALRLADPDVASGRRSTLTYADLGRRAAQVAHFLRDRGVARGDRVVLCLPRGLDQFAAILGVLQAGAAYVPVDWGFPAERIDFIAADAAAKLILTTVERLHDFTHPQVVPLDDRLGEIATGEAWHFTRSSTANTPDDLAYIIYTSGTTGRPKGVAIRHRNIAHLVRSESAILGLTTADVVFQGFSLAFDMSLEEMWPAFLAGAELVVSSEALAKSGPEVAVAIAREGVTVWHCVPSLLAVVDTPLPHVRLINLGGEACPPDLARRWARDGLRLLNTYGPTETSVTATWAELSATAPVTIGTPLPGYRAWVVGEDLVAVPPGTPGELVIGGPGVGEGYVGLAEQTAAKFVTLTLDADAGPELVYRSGDLVTVGPDGNIAFAGRIDTQVKIRGYRVELGEIEAAIGDDPAVAAAVCALHAADGIETLVAYVVARPGATIDTARIAAALKNRLPSYMRPGLYEPLDRLPLLVSGKVDRKALPAPVARAAPTSIEAPETAMETELHRAWSEIFAPLPVSVTADFFEDLGGHSLRAARAVSRARQLPGLAELSINDLYAAPTIRALATRLAARGVSAGATMTTAFAPVPQLRFVLCTIAQTLALPLIYAFAGLQWLLPYLAYVYWASNGLTRAQAAAAGAAAFIALPPILLLISVACKWLVLGRTKAGEYPLWGLYYFRWWFVRRVLETVASQYLAGTPAFASYYRLLGAKVGRDALLLCDFIDTADLATIGDDASLDSGSMLATSAVEGGLLKLGPVVVGARATIGAMAVVGRGARVGDGAMLDGLSALPTAGVIPAGERWSGSPAEFAGKHAADLPPRASAVRRHVTAFALLVAAGLLPIAALIPIAPGLIAMIEVDWSTEGYSFVAFSPLLATAYVILMCALMAAVKWVLLGRVRPGVHAVTSGFYLRFWIVRQLGALALELLHPIYATLFVRPWFRLMGANVGRRAEISTATSVVHDLVTIGPESFIADGVVLGAAQAEPGRIRLAATIVGRRTFVGNSALIPAGSILGDDSLIGVLSRPPEEPALAATPGATWFGSPPLRLPARQVATMFDEGARFNPPKRLVAARLTMETLRTILPLSIFISLLSLLLSVVGDLADMPHPAEAIAIWFAPLYFAFVLVAGLAVVALKWIVVGEYRATTKPLWSWFVWRTELVTATYENLAVNLLLAPLRGTPWLAAYFRLMGAKIGRRVYLDTTDMTEFDLIEIGDDAALNDAAGLQTHLFEDRVMKVSAVRIGARATVGSLAIVLYDAVVDDGAELGDLSVLMKGESLAPGTAWEGSPARPAAR
ncbi:amino acid adenylation domain-containing protein [Polymorphobacter sp. PAMC 29334]|uniref:Pls/PosA family non-ribosomal peptide synthetase n=1 Tax=Polymorphobacter sp. PAMC 29334 TaxID=2862331 RepID=UPI001C756FA4|nr:Pls/PosA family non-ribosomal peptide synthetase [Polymorphobacter sp. PAMC 29334]QYE35249.1 amino acid adenylation domain-containing protein [Polymorphobacter sp. PAMC 29334]